MDIYEVPPLTAEEIAALDDVSDVADDEGVIMPSAPPPTSVDPSRPLEGAPAMRAALENIQSGPSGSRTRRSARAPRSVDLAAMLKEMVEAQQQVDAAAKEEAEKAAGTGLAPAARPEKRRRNVSGQSRDGSGKRSKGKGPMPNPTIMDMRQEMPAKNRPTTFRHMKRLKPQFCAIQIDGG